MPRIRSGRVDWMSRVGSWSERIVPISARKGPLTVMLNSNGILASWPSARPATMPLIPPDGRDGQRRIAGDPVELDAGDELAFERAVEVDGQLRIAHRFEGVEGELAVDPELLVGELADVGEGAAFRPGDEVAADDPAAALVEDHRDHSVERAGGGDVGELHLLDEEGGVEALDPEGQPLGRGLGEIEDGLLEDQLAAGERPAPALDPDLEAGEELVADAAVENVDAGPDEIDLGFLAGRGRYGVIAIGCRLCHFVRSHLAARVGQRWKHHRTATDSNPKAWR